jgi:transcriptional antiterminator RfaH
MPILPKEPEIYPEELLDWPLLADSEGSQWWVIYTLARREKDLMRRLRTLKVPFYCPLTERKTRTPRGRKRVSYVPLFPGYVFLCGREEQRYTALTTNCISKVLPVADPLPLVNDLRQIRQLIDSDAPLMPEARLQRGMRVRIRSGPLMGVEGVVVRRRGRDRLLVAVEFLQRGASVSLEDFEVEAVD